MSDQPIRPHPGDAAHPTEEAVMREVLQAIRTIQFGSVLIKIHEGEVVGIETSTKVRLKEGRRP